MRRSRRRLSGNPLRSVLTVEGSTFLLVLDVNAKIKVFPLHICVCMHGTYVPIYSSVSVYSALHRSLIRQAPLTVRAARPRLFFAYLTGRRTAHECGYIRLLVPVPSAASHTYLLASLYAHECRALESSPALHSAVWRFHKLPSGILAGQFLLVCFLAEVLFIDSVAVWRWVEEEDVDPVPSNVLGQLREDARCRPRNWDGRRYIINVCGAIR